jgi:heme exporter protein A
MTLVVNGLSYERNKKRLFNRLAFQVYPGEALHVLGPNGAGKTSLLQILTGLIAPLRGNILWNMRAIQQSRCFKKELLYIGHHLGVKSALTPFENLYLFLVRRGWGSGTDHSLRQIKQLAKEKIQAVLEKLDLCAYTAHPTHSLSAGQQRRLALAKLLLIKANCWILDEPFTALDAKGIHLISSLMAEQIQRGGMVIFTSHQPLFLSNGVGLKPLFLSGGGG